jgi:hypothetical protein
LKRWSTVNPSHSVVVFTSMKTVISGFSSCFAAFAIGAAIKNLLVFEGASRKYEQKLTIATRIGRRSKLEESASQTPEIARSSPIG